MGCRWFIYEFFATCFLAAIGNGGLAGFTHVPARLARALAIVATLAVKGTALGNQLRTVLGHAEGLEQGRLTRVVDCYAA